MLNFKILEGKSHFFPKKYAQITPHKNKKKCRFATAKKLLKIQSASELCKSPSKPKIQAGQAKLLSREIPVFFEKIML